MFEHWVNVLAPLAIGKSGYSEMSTFLLVNPVIPKCQHSFPQALLPYVDQLSPVIIDCVRDPFYKITSDALLVLQDLVKVGIHFTILIDKQNLECATKRGG